MRYACLISVFCLLTSLTCNKDKEDYEWLNATVSSTSDTNCYLPRLDFSEDSIKIRAITQHHHFLEFVSRGLPEELNVAGKKLRVQVTKETEFQACLTLGISYPGIQIIRAVER
jgi:hypothetical protein